MPRSWVVLSSRLLGLCALAAVLFVPAELAAPRAGLASTAPPNIVLILTDDQRWDAVSQMPTVSAMAARRFTQAYVTTPLCCPSRSSILTGQYAHNHGVITNRAPTGGFSSFDDTHTLATRLHQAGGYRTELLGKYLNQYSGRYVPPGWDTWFAFNSNPDFYFDYTVNSNGVTKSYGSADSDYSTDVLAAQAETFIRSPDTRPFFLYFAPYAPHDEPVPAPRDSTLFSDLAPFRPPSFNEADVSDKPAYMRDVPSMSSTAISTNDEFRKNQLRTLQAVDEAVARIQTALQQTGKLDNTVIVFMGDNGLTWGEHRLSDHKGVPYDEAIHVPLQISYAGYTPTRVDDNHMVLNVDITPTLLDLAGLSISTPTMSVDGVSLKPLLTGGAPSWRTDFLLEGWPGPEGAEGSPVPEWAGVRNGGWKYVEYVTGEKELYDLVGDPFELNNHAGKRAFAGIQSQLAARLAVLREAGKPPYSRSEDTAWWISYAGAWTPRGIALASAGALKYADGKFASATMDWTGTDVSLIMAQGPQMGIAYVTVDGVLTSVDLYAPSAQFQRAVLTKENLGTGTHLITIAPSGRKNRASTSVAIALDAIDTR